MSVASYFESIGDTLETNLVHAGEERIRHNLTVSDQTRRVIGELADKVHWATATAARAMIDSDPRAALDVVEARLGRGADPLQPDDLDPGQNIVPGERRLEAIVEHGQCREPEHEGTDSEACPDGAAENELGE